MTYSLMCESVCVCVHSHRHSRHCKRYSRYKVNKIQFLSSKNLQFIGEDKKQGYKSNGSQTLECLRIILYVISQSFQLPITAITTNNTLIGRKYTPPFSCPGLCMLSSLYLGMLTLPLRFHFSGIKSRITFLKTIFRAVFHILPAPTHA